LEAGEVDADERKWKEAENKKIYIHS